MGSRRWRWIQAAVGLAIVGYALRFLIQNWETIRTTPLEWRIRVVPIVASLGLVLATYGLLVEAWRRVVNGWGAEIAWWPAARVWVLSSMGKYLPGKLWTIAGLGVLGREQGVPALTATASAIVLQLVSIATGALTVAVTGTAALEREHPAVRLVLWSLIGVAAVALGLVLRPALLNWLLRRLGVDATIATPDPKAMAIGVVANGLAWTMYGVALYWLAAGVFVDSRLTLVQAIGAFTASYLAGFLFLLAPGGFGVRETVFFLVTESALGPAQALALAAVSRIGMTLADLLAAAPFVLARRRVHDGT